MNVYEQRQHDQQLRELYRDAARRLFAGVKVSHDANVSPDADKSGAFVECVVWVPCEEAEKERNIITNHA